jgi:hypothetical protein
MKIQKLAIATVVAAVVLLLLDMVWYTMVMKDSMNIPNTRPEPDMMWMIISYVIFALSFVTIYSKWDGGSSKVNSGLNFGLWTGLMVGLSMNLMWYSLTTTETLNQVFVDAAYTIVKYIVVGIVVAYLAGSSHGDRQGGGKIPG